MDNPAQGIVDQPVSADEMAAIDQAASQYGAVVQPTTYIPDNSSNDNSSDDNNSGDSNFGENNILSQDDNPAGVNPIIDTPTPAPVFNNNDQGSGGDDQVDGGQSLADIEVAVASPAPVVASDGGDGTDEELLSVKQQALEELTPIVGTLDLPPEERFDTLMMIIRASDDKKLVKPAYEAANQIEDQDKKARALLDVVNEVNYLTQNNQAQA